MPALSRCACSPGVPRKVLEELDPQLVPALPCQTLLWVRLPLCLCRRHQGGLTHPSSRPCPPPRTHALVEGGDEALCTLRALLSGTVRPAALRESGREVGSRRPAARTAYLGLVRTTAPGSGVGRVEQRGPREQELGQCAGARPGLRCPHSALGSQLRWGGGQSVACHRRSHEPPHRTEEPQEPLKSHRAPLLAPARGEGPTPPCSAPLAHRGWAGIPRSPTQEPGPGTSAGHIVIQTSSPFWPVTCFPRKHVHRGPGGPARRRGSSLWSLGERHWGRGWSLLLRRDSGFRNLLTSPKARTRHRQSLGGQASLRAQRAPPPTSPPPNEPPPPAHWCLPIGSSSRPRRSAAIAKSKEQGQGQS